MPLSATPDSANVLHASGTLNTANVYTELHLPDGRIVRLPTEWLQESAAQTLVDDRAYASAGDPAEVQLGGDVAAEPNTTVIPLIEEHLEVTKRVVTTGKVLLHKTVHSFETQLDEPLAVRSFDIERIILNQPVDTAPAVRQEGDTTIYPLVEEQLVLTKQLVLKEEVRVTRRDTERRDTQIVTLRREHLTVERENA